MKKKQIEVIQNIYDENEKIAKRINEKLDSQNILVINVMGAPGIGKTSVLTQVIKKLKDLNVYVIEGDIESDIDTCNLQKLGINAFQINTKGACHLDAVMIEKAVENWDLKGPGIVFIENIGNLVCPAEFVIGEHFKMLICATTDGSDKPYKYPLAFEKADIIVLNKNDLSPYLDFDYEFFHKGLVALNKKAPVIKVSAKTGDGIDEIVNWLNEKRKV